jgi:penicillin-binding protein 1A
MASPLNRTSQTRRQPGSAMKPLTYLTALQSGLQPNTLVSNDPLKLPPVGIPAKARAGFRRALPAWSRRKDA